MTRVRHIAAPPRANGEPASYSLAAWGGSTLHVTGQIGVDANGQLVTGGIAAETAQAIANLSGILAMADLTLKDVIKCNVWLSRESDFVLYDQIYREAFGDNPPARSTMVCGLILGAAIEIEAIAFSDSTEAT